MRVVSSYKHAQLQMYWKKACIVLRTYANIYSVAKIGPKWTKVPDEVIATSPDPPRGSYSARCDDKGRLKLPVNFQEFVGSQKLFVTTLDMSIARIYPIPAWKDNEKLLGNETEQPEWAESVLFVANRYGADAEVDTQGRVLLPTDLRRHLNLENQPVWLDCSGGAINIYSDTEYKRRETEAMAKLKESLQGMRKKGLK